MGSDENNFNVSLIVRDKVTRQCPETTNFEEKGEPSAYQPNALLLGQTDSQPSVAIYSEPVWPSGKALQAGKLKDLGWISLRLSFLFKRLWFVDTVL